MVDIEKRLKDAFDAELLKPRLKISYFGKRGIFNVMKINYSNRGYRQGKISSIIISYPYDWKHDNTVKIDYRYFRNDIYFDFEGVCSTYQDHYDKHYFYPNHMKTEYTIWNTWDMEEGK